MKENTISFWAQPTSKLEFHSIEEQKIKEDGTVSNGIQSFWIKAEFYFHCADNCITKELMQNSNKPQGAISV